MTLIQFIADRTRFYAYEDLVVEKVQLDADGNQKKRKVFKRCKKGTPGARKRAQRETQQYEITPGFVLAFIAILIIQGAKYSNYCRMCYRSQAGAVKPDGSKKSSYEKKRDCKTSVMGCVQCREPICSDCWGKGYDVHQKKGIECEHKSDA